MQTNFGNRVIRKASPSSAWACVWWLCGVLQGVDLILKCRYYYTYFTADHFSSNMSLFQKLGWHQKISFLISPLGFNPSFLNLLRSAWTFWPEEFISQRFDFKNKKLRFYYREGIWEDLSTIKIGRGSMCLILLATAGQLDVSAKWISTEIINNADL